MKILVVPKIIGAELQSGKAGIYNITLRVCAVYVEKCVSVSVRVGQGLLG